MGSVVADGHVRGEGVASGLDNGSEEGERAQPGRGGV